MCKPSRSIKIQSGQIILPHHSPNELTHIQNILESQSPLVSIKEINKLRQLIARAALGEYFLIQSGDCIENFYDCDLDTSYEKLDFIEQLAKFFQRKTGCNVIRIGRIAGQYANPSNNAYEISQNNTICSYFGDMVNQVHKNHRTPDP
ncbi:3-deoxy-7-phosphoheptulonate synthase, partial [Legionella nautarum]